MFDNLFEVTLLLMVGALLGAGPVWLYYKGVVTNKEETIEEDQTEEDNNKVIVMARQIQDKIDKQNIITREEKKNSLDKRENKKH